MLIAQQKYKENIAEYLLYMWQVEDMIRAFSLNIDDLWYNVLESTNYDEKTKRQVRSWYEGLIEKMRIQSIEEAGHLHELNEIVKELFYIHSALLSNQDAHYKKLYLEAQEYIREFSEKSKSSTLNEIEICLNALYMKLLLRLQQTPISDESEKAFQAFSRLVSYVTKVYHLVKSGEINFYFN